MSPLASMQILLRPELLLYFWLSPWWWMSNTNNEKKGADHG